MAVHSMSAAVPDRAVSLRVSVTSRCQLRCLYCMPGSTAPASSLRPPLCRWDVLYLAQVLKRHWGLKKVHLTGGEPLLHRDILALVECLSAEGVGELALTTNGQVLSSLAASLRRAGLPRINVSLDSLRASTFGCLTRGGKLQHTLAGIDAALEAGLRPVKVNMTVLRGINDDEVTDIAKFALERGCHVRFLELMPIGPAAGHFDQWFVPSEEVRQQLSPVFSFRPLPTGPGGSSRDFLIRSENGLEGNVGFISSHSAPFCGLCRRLRLTVEGDLVGCLALGKGISLGRSLRNHAEPALVKRIGCALQCKRKRFTFPTKRLMAAMGG